MYVHVIVYRQWYIFR